MMTINELLLFIYNYEKDLLDYEVFKTKAEYYINQVTQFTNDILPHIKLNKLIKLIVKIPPLSAEQSAKQLKIMELAIAQGMKIEEIISYASLETLAINKQFFLAQPNSSQKYLNAVLDATTAENKNYKQIMTIKHELINAALAHGAQLENKLTIYHHINGHVFFNLKCADYAGQPISLTVGLYAPLDKGRVSENMYDKIIDYAAIVPIFGRIIAKFMIYTFFSSQHLIASTNEQAKINNPFYEIYIESEGFYLNNDYIDKYNPKFGNYNLEITQSKSYMISQANAQQVYEKLINLVEEPNADYTYKLFSHNCLDFNQEIYELAGLEGKYYNDMYPYGQLSPINEISAYMLYNNLIDWFY